MQCHITFTREAHIGDEVKVSTQLLSYTEKALHYIHVMTHAEDEYLVAKLEQLALHIDLNGPRVKVTPFPEKQLQLLSQMMEAHCNVPS